MARGAASTPRPGSTFVFGDGTQIMDARTILTVIGGQKWYTDEPTMIKDTLWDVHTPALPEVTFREAVPDDRPTRPDAPIRQRRVHIKPSDIETHGFTTGCPRCMP